MDKFLYLGMNGASGLQRSQMQQTHNLANASTPGFRADFNAVISEQIAGPGLETRFNAVETGTGVDTRSGSVRDTGRGLDVAISGDGWFAVEARDGSEAYSRRGDFHINTDGLLFNGAGHPVLGNAGQVSVPEHQSLTIGADGTVSVVPLGQSPDTVVIVDRIKLVQLDDAKLTKGGDGLVRQRDGQDGEVSADVQVMAGHLENSNVNAVEAMVNLINIARNYEMQIKMMASAKEAAETASSLMRLE